ncbi:hypothetical protein HK096_011121, partial [Nowakowskiella sp. JEL0078]
MLNYFKWLKPVRPWPTFSTSFFSVVPTKKKSRFITHAEILKDLNELRNFNIKKRFLNLDLNKLNYFLKQLSKFNPSSLSVLSHLNKITIVDEIFSLFPESGLKPTKESYLIALGIACNEGDELKLNEYLLKASSENVEFAPDKIVALRYEVAFNA